MNRGILFRGKVVNHPDYWVTDINGKWAVGFLVNALDEYPEPNRERIPEIISLEAKRVCSGEYSYYESYEVDPETVGQWTGLVDKNGTKIFEGDILHIHNDYNEVTRNVVSKVIVRFKNGAFVCEYNGDGDSWMHFSGFNTPTVWFEVVGNRWDNPELLEEGA